MKILILGAGQVGSSAAYHLSREEANEVTIVDMRPDVLRELQDRLDIRTVVGHAAYPDVLERAGAHDADIIVALTDSDETNMIACQVAYTVFHTPTKIARIRSADYMNAKRLFTQDAIPIDVRISPEQLVCEYIEQLILYPGASQVLDFADGKVRLVGAKADRDGLLVGQKISTLKEHIPNTEGRIAAIYRDGKAMLPDGDTAPNPDSLLVGGGIVDKSIVDQAWVNTEWTLPLAIRRAWAPRFAGRCMSRCWSTTISSGHTS